MRNKSARRFGMRLAVVVIGRNVCFGGGPDAPDTSGQNEAARVNAEIAREMWGEYQNTYLPMERQFATEASNYDTPGKREQEAGLASADVSQAFGNATQANERQMAGMGVDPNSAKFQAGLNGLSVKRAAADAGAQNKARSNVENMGYARKQDAISIGKGMPGTATTAMNSAGNQYGNIASTQAQNSQANSQAAAGMGSAAVAAADLYHGWKDGGEVRAKPRFAGGGLAGNPRMMQLVANNNPVMPVGKPQQSNASTALKTAKNIKKAKDIYDKANPIAGPNSPIIDQLPVDPSAPSSVPAEVTPMTQTPPVTGTELAPVGTAPGAAPVATTAAETATTEAASTAGAEAAATETAAVAGAETAATAAATTAATTAASGTAAAATGLAAIGPIGWIGLAGLAASQFLKDGGSADGDKIAALKAVFERVFTGEQYKGTQEQNKRFAAYARGRAEEGRKNLEPGEADGRKGGYVTGPGTSTSDSIHALLSDEEFVVNATAVKLPGVKQQLEKINQRGLDIRYGKRRAA